MLRSVSPLPAWLYGLLCCLQDLHTAAPVLEVNGVEYEGHYEDALGSTLIYQECDGPAAYAYLCHTEKKLRFERVLPTTNSDQAARVAPEAQMAAEP